MLNKTLKIMTVAAMLAGSVVSAQAAGYKLRATANSNENDEDYDGLVVFKNYVEAASNGAIEVELFIGTQLCSNGAECLQGVADPPSISTFPRPAALRVSSLTCRFWIFPISCPTTVSPSMFFQGTSPAACATWHWRTAAVQSA
jgi:hypothetical protein